MDASAPVAIAVPSAWAEWLGVPREAPSALPPGLWPRDVYASRVSASLDDRVPFRSLPRC